MSLAEFLSAEDVRQTHLEIFRDRSEEYLRNGPDGSLLQRDVQQIIQNVKGTKIGNMIRSVATFEPGSLERAWSHWMALSAGRHLWPDANHRTGAVSFALAIARRFEDEVYVFDFESAVAGKMALESKLCATGISSAAAGTIRWKN